MVEIDLIYKKLILLIIDYLIFKYLLSSSLFFNRKALFNLVNYLKGILTESSNLWFLFIL